MIHPSAVTPALLASIPAALSGDGSTSPPPVASSPPFQNANPYEYRNVSPPNAGPAFGGPSSYQQPSPAPWELQMQPLQPYPASPYSPQHQFFFDDRSPQIEYQNPYPSSYASGLMSPPLPPPPRPLSAGPYPLATSAIPAITYPQEPQQEFFPTNQNHFTGLPAFEGQAIPPDNPLAEDRASRISRHLRRSSRHRSLSPPRGRPSLLRLDAIPAPIMEYSNIAPQRQNLPDNSQPPLLSPRPGPSPQTSYFDEQEGASRSPGGSGQSPRVQELERIVSSFEEDKNVADPGLAGVPVVKAATESAVVSPRLDKTLPRAPSPALLPHITTLKDPGRSGDQSHPEEEHHALPAAALGDSSTIDTSAALSSEVSDTSKYAGVLEFDSSPTTLKAPIGAAQPSGLTLLERRLRLPAAYEIFNQATEDAPRTSNETVSSTAVGSSSATTAKQSTSKPSPAVDATTLPAPRERTTRRKRSSNGNDRELAAVEEEKNARVSAWVHQETQKPSEVVESAPTSGNQQAELQEDPPVALKVAASTAVSHGASDLDWTTLKRVRSDASDGRHSLISLAFGTVQPAVQDRLGALYEANNKLGDTKYDVRSARGGRGGVVSSAAAFWSNMSPITEAPSKSGPSSKAPRPLVPRKSIGFTKTVLPLDTIKIKPRSPAPKTPSFQQRSAARALPVQEGINRTIPRPIFSSSASLARDSNLHRISPVAVVPAFSSANPPSESPNGPIAAPRAIGLGRDRLRELISKYQTPS